MAIIAEVDHLGHRHAIVQRDHDVRGLDGGSARFGLRGQQRLRFLVRREQCVEALAEACIAFTHDVEKRGAFLRRLFQRQGKQGFFAGWVHVLRV